MLPIRMLLLAMPPVSWPTASIFCDWRSACSACRRAVVSTGYHGGGHAVGVQQQGAADVEAAPPVGSSSSRECSELRPPPRRWPGQPPRHAVGVGEPRIRRSAGRQCPSCPPARRPMKRHWHRPRARTDPAAPDAGSWIQKALPPLGVGACAAVMGLVVAYFDAVVATMWATLPSACSGKSICTTGRCDARARPGSWCARLARVPGWGGHVRKALMPR